MTDPQAKPIHPDIPTDRAWQVSRRLYVRCGYQSQLNSELRELGAKWDGDVRALWVGSGKRDQVVAAVQRTLTRVAEVDAVKAAGRWVAIPFDAADIRARAKEHGAIWDGDRKQWAMPSDDSYQEVSRLVGEYRTAQDAERAAAREAGKRSRAAYEAEVQQAAAEDAEARRERIVAQSGRTPIGDTTQYRVISTRRMNKVTAREVAEPNGTVITLKDGRRGVITGVDIWFTGDEMASSVCWHPETHDQAHWDFLYTVAIVEPTQAEVDADAKAAAERDTGAVRGGTLIRTRDGHVVWQHPGYYDDYIPTEGESTDPGLLARVDAVLAAGTRNRVVYDQLAYRYQITGAV